MSYSDSPLANRTVLITGGSGSFGRAFARRALNDGARKVVIFSRGEAAQAAMRASLNDERLRFFLGDVRDYPRLFDACRGIEIVIHAAAAKRIESCAENPHEAIATNILGTQHVARACIATGVRRAVLLSTDKAAAPSTLYGSTKLVAERAWIGANIYAAGTPTRFSVTRYGNVLSSTGSVIPTWRAQVAAGQPLTITHHEATRFFMPMTDACALVIHALSAMRGGEIFVPKLRAAQVITLADALFGNYPWRMIDLRPGEKLHEVLITPDEARTTYDADTCFVIEPDARTWESAPVLPPVPYLGDGFMYGSETAPRFTLDELRELVA